MLSPDHVLINRAARILPEYNLANNQDKPNKFIRFTSIIPLVLVGTAYCLDDIVPAKPVELLGVNLGVFVIAVALARLCGRVGTWIGASAAMLLIAWIIPPAAWRWFDFNALMIVAVALAAPHHPIRWPQLRTKAAQSTGKDLENSNRRLAVDRNTQG